MRKLLEVLDLSKVLAASTRVQTMTLQRHVGQARADPNAADLSGEPPLIEAACYGDLEVAKESCHSTCCVEGPFAGVGKQHRTSIARRIRVSDVGTALAWQVCQLLLEGRADAAHESTARHQV